MASDAPVLTITAVPCEACGGTGSLIVDDSVDGRLLTGCPDCAHGPKLGWVWPKPVLILLKLLPLVPYAPGNAEEVLNTLYTEKEANRGK